YPRIFDDPNLGPHARQLFDEAVSVLRRIIDERLLTANGVYGFFPANSDGDDIVLQVKESGIRNQESENPKSKIQNRKSKICLHTLRQQWERAGQKDFRALADYIAPAESG